jgi:hypothetical protein
MAAGLTLGFMSFERSELEIKQSARLDEAQTNEERRVLEKEQQDSHHILPLLKDHHLLLVTLLLLNALANEALPIFLTGLEIPEVLSVLLACTLVLICGEIMPSAFFTGPHQMTIASTCVPCVRFLLLALYPVAKPIALALDYLLSHEEEETYSRPTLRAVLKMHSKPSRSEDSTLPQQNPASTANGHGENGGWCSEHCDAMYKEAGGEQCGAVCSQYCGGCVGLCEHDAHEEHHEPPLDALESHICFGILDTGEETVCGCAAFRSCRRCISDFHAAAADDNAWDTARVAAAAQMGAVAVFFA